MVIAKLATVTSIKEDATIKYRLILDCRLSGTNSATTTYERVVLPLVWDVVRIAPDLMTGNVAGSEVSWLVCDVQDAFFTNYL